jgi:16S rRNA (guanine527-N7)-methyltransferase
MFEDYMQIFLEQNSRVNLISKNDEKFLYEKHFCDSLAIGKFFERFSTAEMMLDIGTGGGFPAVPVAIAYPQLQVFAIDSIRKKINAIEQIKLGLGLENLTCICGRAEELTQRFDVVTARAVAPLKELVPYALGDYLVAWKSVKVNEEIQDAQSVLKKHNAKVVDVIEYDLMEHTRNLVVIKYLTPGRTA